MKDLQDGRSTATLCGLCQLAQTGDETVIVGGELAREADPFRCDVRTSGDDHADILGARLDVGGLLVGDGFVWIGGPGCHWRHDDAISQRHTIFKVETVKSWFEWVTRFSLL